MGKLKPEQAGGGSQHRLDVNKWVRDYQLGKSIKQKVGILKKKIQQTWHLARVTKEDGVNKEVMSPTADLSGEGGGREDNHKVDTIDNCVLITVCRQLGAHGQIGWV